MTYPLGTKCPRCFLPLDFDRVAWTMKGAPDNEPDPIASEFAGNPIVGREVYTAERPENAANWSPLPADVTFNDIDIACPTCHYALPSDWLQSTSTCIAMAGARYTGKTVYIAVLIKQLENLAARFNREVLPADRSTADRYREIYEKPLYVEQGIAQATPSAASVTQRPLIFDLGRWGDQPKHYLVIRDVAGEDLENPHNVGSRALGFFSHADAVFFLFDPLRVEDISNQLRDLIPEPPGIGGDPKEVLHTVLDLIGTGNPRLAVILSKFDAFQQLSHVHHSAWGRVMSNAGAAFNRDPGSLSKNYDNFDGELLDAEVRSLLHRLGASPSLRTMMNPRTGTIYSHRFFAVSALGESPSGQKLHRNGISPFRCTDPIRWLFARSGILEDAQL